ncbi:MAG: amino acid permease [Bacteroidota bacterium]|nr:amino acid permease [Bacteroidota bacterium]
MFPLGTKGIILTALAFVLVVVFAYLWRKKDLLAVFSGGRWWLTWFAVSIITQMDELTSVFYAPAEAYRFIGGSAVIFLALTSVFMRFLSTRMTEIAQILEHHNIRGGGVYSFSYLVLGPTVSFVAVSSILVTYVLTASISTVSAVQNGLAFVDLPPAAAMVLNLAVVWSIAGLNILGIRENARFTFGVFTFAAFVLLLLLASGILAVDGEQVARIRTTTQDVFGCFLTLHVGEQARNMGYLITGIASCILAYSGIESVIQTAGLSRSWHDCRKAYNYRVVTVGVFTPLLSLLVLSSGIDVLQNETDLITQYAAMLNGRLFGYAVAAVASFTLVFAVNTAFIASSELLERVAERYGFTWLVKVNRRRSLYRIHIISGVIYSVIILVTRGSQAILAEMYAIGLIASFAINLGSLLVYRYFQGTKEIRRYFTHRSMTLLIFLLVAACFVYLAFMKPYGLMLWALTTGLFLFLGLAIARKRAPEVRELRQTDSPLELVARLGSSEAERIHLYFRRPKENVALEDSDLSRAYVSFFSPRQGIPPRVSESHFRFPSSPQSLSKDIRTIIELLRYELPHMKLTVHIGWPMSSWLDRLAIGYLVMNVMRLPKLFPDVAFRIEYDEADGAARSSPPASS